MAAKNEVIDVRAVVRGPLGLRIEQVVELTGLCPRTIRAWSKDGRFPAPRVLGHAHRWDLDEIFEWWRDRPRGDRYRAKVCDER